MNRFFSTPRATSDRLCLVIDDLHVLGSDWARGQLEILTVRALAELQFVWPGLAEASLGAGTCWFPGGM